MAYIHGFTTAKHVLKDLALAMTTGDKLTPSNNWDLIYPDPSTSLEATTELKVKDILGFEDDTTVISKICLKAKTKLAKHWIKQEPLTFAIDTDTKCKVQTNSPISVGGGTRIFVRGSKMHLYLKTTAGEPDVNEYIILSNDTAGKGVIQTHTALASKEVLVDYETSDTTVRNFYVEMTLDVDADKYFQANWKIGENYDHATQVFPVDHYSTVGVLSWFRPGTENEKYWLPIEFWLSFDNNAVSGVIMGDPGMSLDKWVSSPFYFGMVEQLDGALESDTKGNFGGYSGSTIEPVHSTMYSDFTGNGVTDITMVSTKTGRPYQSHKVQLFGGYEFREKTFNGQSLHTGKHGVSDIVVADLNENERGNLFHCLAVPRVGKEHGVELIYKRYESGEEKTYVFLNINAPYTPFNTGNDVLIGIALRTDI